MFLRRRDLFGNGTVILRNRYCGYQKNPCHTCCNTHIEPFHLSFLSTKYNRFGYTFGDRINASSLYEFPKRNPLMLESVAVNRLREIKAS